MTETKTKPLIRRIYGSAGAVVLSVIILVATDALGDSPSKTVAVWANWIWKAFVFCLLYPIPLWIPVAAATFYVMWRRFLKLGAVARSTPDNLSGIDKTQENILTYLLIAGLDSFYVEDLANEIKINPHVIRNAADDLCVLGVLDKSNMMTNNGRPYYLTERGRKLVLADENLSSVTKF